MEERRRSPGRRWDDARSCLFPLFVGFAYGVVITAAAYAWILPILR